MWGSTGAQRHVVRAGDHKWIIEPEKEDQLFDLAADLSEKTSLVASETGQIAERRRHIEARAEPMVELRSGKLGSWEFGNR